jgi:hypothetical protein
VSERGEHELEHKEMHVERQLIEALRENSKALKELARALQPKAAATGGEIFQLGENSMAITGTKVGGTSKFNVVWNGGMTPGAAVVWKSSDPGITLTPDPADATGNTIIAVDALADTLTSYTLDVSGTASDGTAVKATTATVPLLTAPATGGTISQVS